MQGGGALARSAAQGSSWRRALRPATASSSPHGPSAWQLCKARQSLEPPGRCRHGTPFLLSLPTCPRRRCGPGSRAGRPAAAGPGGGGRPPACAAPRSPPWCAPRLQRVEQSGEHASQGREVEAPSIRHRCNVGSMRCHSRGAAHAVLASRACNNAQARPHKPTRGRGEVGAQRGQHQLAVEQRQAAQALGHDCTGGERGAAEQAGWRVKDHSVPMTALQKASACSPRGLHPHPPWHPPARHSSSVSPAAPSSSCSTSACCPSLMALALPAAAAP